MTKSTIKRLALAINDALNRHETGQEMAALYDYGEWSSSSPDFGDVVAAWGLSRKQLSEAIDIAEGYMAIENQNRKGQQYPGFWWQTIQMLHCPFMAGNL